VATPDRHGGTEKAEAFFLDGMAQAMHQLAAQAHPAFPVTIYYAFKQSESDVPTASPARLGDFLDAVIAPAFAITVPGRCGRNLATACGAWALTPWPQASSSSAARAPTMRHRHRREFDTALKAELPVALAISSEAT